MPVDWTPLQRCVAANSGQVDIAIGVIAPDGSQWSHRGDEQFPAASTAKIPIMVEIYRKIGRGEVSIDYQHVVERSEHSAGSGVLQHMHGGLGLTIADLLYLMIAISDNTATNILIALAGMPRINATMRSLGMTRSILGRPMVGRLAVEGEQENLATARDYTKLMQAIIDGRAASEAACDSMLATLQLQQNNRRIGRHVPSSSGFSWGSKNGTNEGIANDVGFVTGPRGTMAIAVYCRGVADETCGEAVIADLSACAMRATGLVQHTD